MQAAVQAMVKTSCSAFHDRHARRASAGGRVSNPITFTMVRPDQSPRGF
jgi:hypothetical protein